MKRRETTWNGQQAEQEEKREGDGAPCPLHNGAMHKDSIKRKESHLNSMWTGWRWHRMSCASPCGLWASGSTKAAWCLKRGGKSTKENMKSSLKALLRESKRQKSGRSGCILTLFWALCVGLEKHHLHTVFG